MKITVAVTVKLAVIVRVIDNNNYDNRNDTNDACVAGGGGGAGLFI